MGNTLLEGETAVRAIDFSLPEDRLPAGITIPSLETSAFMSLEAPTTAPWRSKNSIQERSLRGPDSAYAPTPLTLSIQH